MHTDVGIFSGLDIRVGGQHTTGEEARKRHLTPAGDRSVERANVHVGDAVVRRRHRAVGAAQAALLPLFYVTPLVPLASSVDLDPEAQVPEEVDRPGQGLEELSTHGACVPNWTQIAADELRRDVVGIERVSLTAQCRHRAHGPGPVRDPELPRERAHEIARALRGKLQDPGPVLAIGRLHTRQAARLNHLIISAKPGGDDRVGARVDRAPKNPLNDFR